MTLVTTEGLELLPQGELSCRVRPGRVVSEGSQAPRAGSDRREGKRQSPGRSRLCKGLCRGPYTQPMVCGWSQACRQARGSWGLLWAEGEAPPVAAVTSKQLRKKAQGSAALRPSGPAPAQHLRSWLGPCTTHKAKKPTTAWASGAVGRAAPSLEPPWICLLPLQLLDCSSASPLLPAVHPDLVPLALHAHPLLPFRTQLRPLPLKVTEGCG